MAQKVGQKSGTGTNSPVVQEPAFFSRYVSHIGTNCAIFQKYETQLGTSVVLELTLSFLRGFIH